MDSNATEMSTEAKKIHPFERNGLGIAPFKYVGFYVSKYQAIPGDPSCPIQPGSSCDHCGTAIMNVCRIKSADGREFKVGSDCVGKVGRAHDAALLTAVEAAARKRAGAARKSLAAARAAELATLLATETVRATLALQPHPHPYRAGLGDTLLDAIEFSVKRSGAAGIARTLKTVKAQIA